MVNFKIKKINNVTWEIEKTGLMKVPVIIFASEKLLEDIYCKNCLAGTKQDLEIPKSKKFVLTVLDAIGIVY